VLFLRLARLLSKKFAVLYLVLNRSSCLNKLCPIYYIKATSPGIPNINLPHSLTCIPAEMGPFLAAFIATAAAELVNPALRLLNLQSSLHSINTIYKTKHDLLPESLILCAEDMMAGGTSTREDTTAGGRAYSSNLARHGESCKTDASYGRYSTAVSRDRTSSIHFPAGRQEGCRCLSRSCQLCRLRCGSRRY
jgi:hypothetical protein